MRQESECTEMTPTHRLNESSASGFALIELLVVLLALGALGAIAAFAVGEFTTSGSHSRPGGSTTISNAHPLSSQPSAAAEVACDTDARIIQSAVTVFEATNNGTVPTADELTKSSQYGPYLREYPRSGYFTISIDSKGNVNVALSAAAAAATAPHLYPIDKAPFQRFAVNFESWSWSEAGTRGSAYPADANVCAGA